MRLRSLFSGLLCVCTVQMMFSVPSAADEPVPTLRKDPRKLAISNGLNGAIRLPAALLAIDDKSPMSFSVNSGRSALKISKAIKSISDNINALGLIVEGQPAAKQAFVNGLTNINTQDDFVNAVTAEVIRIQSKPEMLQADTKVLIQAEKGELGNSLLPHLLLRDYVLAVTGSLRKDNRNDRITFQVLKAIDYTDAQYQVMEENLPLDIIKQSLYAGVQVRSGGGPTVDMPEVIYSNGKSGFDIAAQYYLSRAYGYGLAFRYDLTPGRPDMVGKVLALDRVTDKVNGRRALPERSEKPDGSPVPLTTGEKNDIKARLFQFAIEEKHYNETKATAIEAVVHNSQSLRFAFVGSQRGIGGIGSFTDAGFSVSQLLIPCPGKPYNGVTVLGSIQALQYAPDSLSSSATLREGLAVFWQDRVSRSGLNKGVKFSEINRWTTQVGAEYNFHNSLQQRDTYGFFVRQRLEKFTEVSLSVGQSENSKMYVGFSLGHTFSM